MKQKIQFALDTDSITDAESMARELDAYWDILEIGTILLYKEGIGCVNQFRSVFPEADILVDTKIVDSGSRITSLACEAGANMITVISTASEKTIMNCIETAHKYNCKVVLDHVSEVWDSPDLLRKSKLGIDIVGFHLPKDMQYKGSIKVGSLSKILEKIDQPVSIAGGIDPDMIRKCRDLPIQIFVVGGFLLDAQNKIQNAKLLRSQLEKVREDKTQNKEEIKR